MTTLTLEPPPVHFEPPGLVFADDVLDLLLSDFDLPESLPADEWIELDPIDPADRAAWAEQSAELEARAAELDRIRHDELLDELYELRSGQAFPERWHEIEVIEAAGHSALARCAQRSE